MTAGEANVRMVLAPNPSPMTLDGTRTFIVGRARPAVIDPGPDDSDHLQALEEALAGVPPAAIILTHAHSDHSGGAPELARRTGAPLCMAAGALHDPALTTHVTRWLASGDEIRTDAGTMCVLETPGHVPEHIALTWSGAGAPAGGAAFVGDLLMGEGDTSLVAPPEGDLFDYLSSLERLEEEGVRVLYPTHGPPIEDAAEALARYRSHRMQRIDQVVAALGDRPDATPRELVDVIYGSTLDPALRGAAAGSISAILNYLERAGAH